MYHSPVLQRSPTDDDDRLKRERMAASTTTQPPPSYTANSPTNSHFSPFSPTTRSHPQLAYGTQYPSRPTPTPSALPLPSGMSQSPRHGPPPSPTSNGLTHINTSMYPPRESGNSTYYDPTSEYREGSMAWAHSHSSTRSPRQVCTIDTCKSYQRAILLLPAILTTHAHFRTETRVSIPKAPENLDPLKARTTRRLPHAFLSTRPHLQLRTHIPQVDITPSHSLQYKTLQSQQSFDVVVQAIS